MNKLKVKTKELFECNCPFLKETFDESTYPWEMLSKIKSICKSLIEKGIPGYKEISPGILVGENVKIANNCTILPPTIIGANTEIRPGAFIRGNVIIGEDCVIGNCSEVKNSILLRHVLIPHYNYVGDSILGNHSHMGASSITSNLRSDAKNVIIHGDKEYETGLQKVGAFLGDHTEIGCGSVLNPGTIVGKSSQVYPLITLRGVYPKNSVIKNTTIVVERK